MEQSSFPTLKNAARNENRNVERDADARDMEQTCITTTKDAAEGEHRIELTCNNAGDMARTYINATVVSIARLIFLFGQVAKSEEF